MVDVCVETEIRELSPKTFVSLPKEFWDNKKSLDEIFCAIAAATDLRIKDEQVCKSVWNQNNKWDVIPRTLEYLFKMTFLFLSQKQRYSDCEEFFCNPGLLNLQLKSSVLKFLQAS